MKSFRTIVSIVIMFFAGIIGFLVGASLEGGLDGAILCSMIAGIACVIYTIDNQDK